MSVPRSIAAVMLHAQVASGAYTRSRREYAALNGRPYVQESIRGEDKKAALPDALVGLLL